MKLFQRATLSTGWTEMRMAEAFLFEFTIHYLAPSLTLKLIQPKLFGASILEQWLVCGIHFILQATQFKKLASSLQSKQHVANLTGNVHNAGR